MRESASSSSSMESKPLLRIAPILGLEGKRNRGEENSIVEGIGLVGVNNVGD